MTWSSTNERLLVAELYVQIAVHSLRFVNVVECQLPGSVTTRRCVAQQTPKIIDDYITIN